MIMPQYKKVSFLILILTFLITPQILAQTFKLDSPIISTSKRNYRTNETVNIVGSNFQKYERVRINVSYFENNLKHNILLAQWDVYADGRGSVNSGWKVMDVNQDGSNFTIEAEGTSSGLITKTEFSTFAPTATSVDIHQCANTNAVPQNMDCPSGGPAGWVSGLVGSSKSLYFEGDSISYRNIMEDMVVGNSYKWTVQYDTSKGGINALDYLTTYNRSITNANPCANGANPNGFCTAGPASSTFNIPTDPNVTNGRDQVNGTSDDISQIAGVISAWGGTITAVSLPTYSGTFPGGDSTASVDITFTANSPTVVLAWGGHIATRTDWGQAFGSVNISGSPYHTSNGGLMNLTANTTCCGGSMDLQLSDAAVIATGRIIIIKHATPPSNFVFGFTTTNLNPTNFTLTDASSITDPSFVFDNISTFNTKTITESNPIPYMLTSINCTVDIGTGGTPAPTQSGNSININIQPGDQVTCTFNNDFVTAAESSISGKVFDANGNGLVRAAVTLTDSNGNNRTVMTNLFGKYQINNVNSGESYLINVNHKGYNYTPQIIDVSEDIDGLNFYPNQ